MTRIKLDGWIHAETGDRMGAINIPPNDLSVTVAGAKTPTGTQSV